MKPLLRWLLILCLGGLISCSVNILENFGNKESDEARYVAAKKSMDRSDYDGAITSLLATSAGFQQKREVRALLASAYAGRGGLDFLRVIEGFSNSSGVTLFPFLMNIFTEGDAAKFQDLKSAEQSLNSISSDPAQRNQDENILHALISLAQLGTVLNYYMDANDDGVMDGTFVDACLDNDDPGVSMDDGAVGEVGLSLLNFLKIVPHLFNNFSSNVLGPIDDCVDDIESLEPLPGNFPLAGVCSIEDPADFAPIHILGFRTLIKENSMIGVGVSCTGDPSVCHCP